MEENVESDHLRVQGPGEDQFEVPDVLAVLPVRDVVVFPGVTVPLAIGRPRSLEALEQAGSEGHLLVATQRDPSTESPSLDDLYPVATLVRVMRVIDARHDAKQALVVGIARVRLTQAQSTEPALRTSYEPLPETGESASEIESLWQRVVDLAQRVIELRDDLPDDWKEFLAGIPSPGLLADLIASNLPLSPEEKIALLEDNHADTRLNRVEDHLKREVTIAETQRALRDEAESEEVDPRRREQMLRSRMREIQSELGEADPGIREVDEIREKLDEIDLPEEAREQAERELKRLSSLPQHAPDRHLIRTYLDWITDLPWDRETEDRPRSGPRSPSPRRRPPRSREGQRPHPRIPFRTKTRAGRQSADSLLRRAAWRGEDFAWPIDRARHGAAICAGIPGRSSRRGRDPWPPAHLRGRHARANSPKP